MNDSGLRATLTFSLLALALAALPASAQNYSVEPIPEGRAMPVADNGFSQAELDQMLAPIALYPDTLLSQVLIASTYPLEIVEAARWSRQNPRLQGDEAVAAVAERDWDPSVKALVAFPELLAQLDTDLDWTRRLGDAMLYQEAQVMDSVQFLRARADAAGSLENPEFVRVVREEQTIVIEPVQTRVVHVPVYNPTVVYGNWWWPTHPPVFWAPPPFFVVGAPGFYWGSGIHVSSGFWFTNFWWPQRSIVIVNSPRFHPRGRQHWSRPHWGHGQRWQHNPVHRRGVAYRHPEVRQRHNQQRLAAGQATRWPLQGSPTRNLRPSGGSDRSDGQWNRGSDRGGDRANVRGTGGRDSQWDRAGRANRGSAVRGSGESRLAEAPRSSRPDVARIEQGLRGTRQRLAEPATRGSANRTAGPQVRASIPSQRNAAAPQSATTAPVPSERPSAGAARGNSQALAGTRATRAPTFSSPRATPSPRAAPSSRATPSSRAAPSSRATSPAPAAAPSSPAPQQRAAGRGTGASATPAGSGRGPASASAGSRPSGNERASGGNRGGPGGERRSAR